MPLWVSLVAIVVALGVIAAFAFAWRQEGAASAQRDAAQKGNDDAGKANRIEERVRDLTDAERERLLARRD